MLGPYIGLIVFYEGLKMSNNAPSNAQGEINEFNIDDICVDEDVFGAARKGWAIIGINIGLLSTMFLFF